MADSPAPNPQSAAYRPRYSSLDDYIQVLRRRRWLILALTVLGLALGLALSLSADKTYTATASLSFRDTSQDLALFGVDADPESAPTVRAAVNAERVTRPEVTNKVAKKFKGELTAADLVNAVSTRVGAQTQLVVLEASADDPELAARIANTYARTTAKLGAREIDVRLAAIQRSLERELDNFDVKDLRREPGSATKVSVLQQQLSRVKTLRDIAEPVEITQSATPPTSADNASPVLAALIGALIGLVFGLIGAFTRDALDRRVRNSQEVHAELAFSVVGRVPDSALGYPGLARDPAREPITEADFEAFRVLRTNLSFISEAGEPRVVLVAGSQPQEGKTTVSMSLASAAAMAGSRVLLLEGDLRRPSFAHRLQIEPTPGLAEYLRGSAEPVEVVQLVDLYPPSAENGPPPAAAAAGARLACITAGGLGGDAAELLASDRFADFIAEVREAYELIVIDSSPLLSVVDPLQLVEQADVVLLCARAHQTKREELRAARSALSNLPERPYGAVVTGLRRDGPDAYSYYYGY